MGVKKKKISIIFVYVKSHKNVVYSSTPGHPVFKVIYEYDPYVRKPFFSYDFARVEKKLYFQKLTEYFKCKTRIFE